MVISYDYNYFIMGFRASVLPSFAKESEVTKKQQQKQQIQEEEEEEGDILVQNFAYVSLSGRRDTKIFIGYFSGLKSRDIALGSVA